MRIVMLTLTSWVIAATALAGEYRIFCESADAKLPHYFFNFYPDEENSPIGTAVVTLDRGVVLDIKKYDGLEVEILDKVVRVIYEDGSLEFDNTDEFENPGNVKHIGGSIALVEDLLCYRNAEAL